MYRRRRVFVRSLAMATGTGILLLLGNHLSAQTPASPQAPSSGGVGLLGEGAVTGEVSPHFFLGPKGEVLRLWEQEGDPKAGGSAVLLAVAKPHEAWERLLEIRPHGKGVSAREGSLAVRPSGEQLAVVYRWWRFVPRSKEIRVVRSDDGGKTWRQLPGSVDTSGKAFSPRIAWSDKSLVVVWADERRGDQLFDIYARRSPDGGQTWEPEQILSRFPEQVPSDIYARPLLVSDGQNRLWAAWVGFRSTHSAVYLSRSTDGGRHWADPVSLTGDSRSVYGHILLRAGDRMMLVWQDTRTGHDRVYAVSSNDNGATWTAPARVDHLPDSSPVDASSPTAILKPDGEAFVAWHDRRNGRHDDMFVARSLDGGRTWGKEDLRMDTDEAGTAVSRFGKLASARDGRIALVWEDDRSGQEQIYLRVRSAGDRGVWGQELRVTTPTAKHANHLPELIWGSDGALHLTWQAWDMTRAPSLISKQVKGRTLKLDSPGK
jgi:hypothetical protein